MELVRKKDIHLQPQYMHKVRCFNCNKVFTHNQTLELEKYKWVNNILNRTFERVKLEDMSTDDLEVFILELKRIAPLPNTEGGMPFPFSQDLEELFNLVGGKKTKDKKGKKDLQKVVKSFVDKYRMKPFDITEVEEDFQNNFEAFLEENFKLRRMCCKMHFQTPYMLSQGLTNQIVVPGYESRFTVKKKEAGDAADLNEVEDAMGLMQETRRKVVRKKKEKTDFVMPEEAHGAAQAFATNVNDEAMKMLQQERDERKRRKIIQEQEADLGTEGEVELLSPEEIGKLQKGQEFKELPFQTPAKEKGKGRLDIPIAKVDDKMKRAGRGRPKAKEGGEKELKKPKKK